MAFTIDCYGNASDVLNAVNRHIALSRFVVSDITTRTKRQSVCVCITGIRLAEPKPYCGNHAGPCQNTGGKHRNGRWLEGNDWVAFNDMLNDALDSINHDGDVASSVCNIRKGRKRRTEYSGTGHGDWTKYADDIDYVDCCGKRPPETEVTIGTPGITGWRDK